MANKSDNFTENLILTSVVGFLLSYLLMTGFGNVGGDVAFWDMLPFGFLLAFVRFGKSNG